MFGVFLFKIPVHFYVESDILILKFMQKYQGPRISKTILKKNKIGVFILHSFQTLYKGTIIETVMYGHKYKI